jgi:hypothetical protein
MNKIVWLIPLIIGCGGKLQTLEGEDEETENVAEQCGAPEIDHNDIDETQPVGQPVEILASVTVEEDCEVLVVEVYYTSVTSLEWSSTPMGFDSISGEYRAMIPGSAVVSGGVRYYLKAVDTEDNTTIEPEGAIEDFFEAFDFGVD